MAIHAATLDVRIVADSSDAEAGISSFDKKLQSAGKTMKKVGVGMSAAITAPLVGLAAAGLKSAMEFETNMNVLQQAVGATASEMQGLQAQALSLGASTIFSAGEAAEAMVELGKAGMDTSEIMDSIAGVMDLAAAGGIGLAEAAGLTASALSAFGLEASEADRVADLFAATANASQANISDLGQGMKAAGFAFKLADQPIENLAASLALLTNVGLTGSDAGTALKNAFLRMMNPTQEAKKAMDRLGISFYDANGNMKALPDIIDMLNVSMSGLTNEQRDLALSTIFMSDGMKAMTPLMDAGREGFNAMVTEVTATGAAMDAAAARTKGLAGGIEYFQGSVDSFMIGAALPFLGTLNEWVIALGDAVTWFGNLPQPIINAGLAIGGILAVTGPLLIAFGLMAPAIGAIGTAFAALNAPILLAVAAVAALAVAYATNFGDIQTHVGTAVSFVQSQLSMLGTAAQTFASGVSAAFSKTTFPTLDELWADFKAGDFETIATKIKDTAFELMVNLDTELNISGKAAQLRQSIVEGINSAIEGIGNLNFSGVKSSFNTLRQSIQDTLATAFSGINASGATAAFGKIRTSIQEALTTAFNGINASGASAALSKIRTSIQGALITAFSGINVSGIKQSLTTLRATIESTLISSFGTTNLGAIVSSIKTSMNSLRDSVLSNMTTAIEGMNFDKAGKTVAGMIDKLTAGIKDLNFKDIDWAGVLQTGLVGPIGAAIKGIVWVIDSPNFDGLVTAVKGAIGTIPWADLGTSFAGLGTAIGGQIDSMIADLQTRFAPAAPSPAVIPATTQIKPEMELDVDWSGLTISTAGLVDAATASIGKVNWFAIGQIIGDGLVRDVKTVLGTMDFVGNIIPTVKAQLLGFGAKVGFEIGTALKDLDFGQSLFALETQIKAAIATTLVGVFSEIGTQIAEGIGLIRAGSLEDATSTSDILRERQTGLDAFEWPPLPEWVWPDYVSWEWGEYAEWTWPEYLQWTWPEYLTFTWPDYTAWTWPDYTAWEWPTYAKWEWPAYLTWTWPEIPTPGWLSSLISAISGGAAAASAPAGVKEGDTYPRMVEDESRARSSKGLPSLRPDAEASSAGMAPMNWADYITPLVWATYVPNLNWESIVKPLDWEAIVVPLEWAAFVMPLDWNGFVTSVEWASFVPAVEWSAFVSSLSWDSFVSRVNWGSYINNVSWESYIPGLDWGNFVTTLDWGRYISALTAGSGGGDSAAPAVAAASVSAASAGAVAAAGVNVNVTANVASDMDIQSMALTVAREINRRVR